VAVARSARHPAGLKKALLASSSAIALAFASCGEASSAAAAGAVGTYELDKAPLKEAMAASGAAAADIDKVLAAMQMTIELKADGTTVMTAKGMGDDKPATGTWKLDGSKLTITAKDTPDGPDESRTVDYANGTFTLDMGPEAPAKMVFRRK